MKHLHGPDAWAGSGVTTDANVLGRGAEIGRLMAESLLKLQQDRDAEIRAAVARQQAGLLNQLAEEAVAPMTELEIAKAASEAQQRQMQPGWYDISGKQHKPFDAVAFEALERQVKWLMERGSTHARQIAQLLATTKELTARVKDLEHVIAETASVGHMSSTPMDFNRITPPLAGAGSMGSNPVAVGVHEGDDRITMRAECVHDLNRKNTTVSAITRKKARCNVCAQVWESI